MFKISDENKRKILLDSTSKDIAASFTQPLQAIWDHPPPKETTRYQRVLDHVRVLGLILPDHEVKVRAIINQISWPVASDKNPDDFPWLTYEEVFEAKCDRCNGFGVSGFISTIRCPVCKGSGFA